MPCPDPTLAQATSSCLRHEGLRATWCRARFGDRAPWKALWEAAFADDEEGGDGEDDVDCPLVVRLATSLSAREKVQVDVCGPRCVGPQCLVAATELDAALGGGGERRPLRAALAALLADVEDRADGDGGDDDGSVLLLPRHRPDGNLPPPPSPPLPLLESQREAASRIDAVLASGARLVSVSGSGGKTTAVAAAARAFLARARGRRGSSESDVDVVTRWDKCFWLDARGTGDDDGGGEEDVDGDDDPDASPYRSLLSAIGGSSVPGASDRDRVLLRARALFGDDSGSRGGLVVRVGREQGMTSALLDVLGAARGLSVVAVGGDGGDGDGEKGDAISASVVVRPLSGDEARSFLKELLSAGDEKRPRLSSRSPSLSPSSFAESPPLRDVRVLRAIAGLESTFRRSPVRDSSLDGWVGVVAARASSRSPLSPSSSSSPPSSSSFVASLASLFLDPSTLLSLSRLSRPLLSGLGGSFSLFAAAAALNCDCGEALQALRSLEALGLARPAEAAPSPSSPSPSLHWSVGSLAASAASMIWEGIFRIGEDGDESSDSLASLARVSAAASAALAASLEFGRGRSGGGGRDPDSSCCSGGSALASHWVTRERALFSCAVPLALSLRGQARTRKGKETDGRRRLALSSVALSSLSTLLWNGGDRLLPGILGHKKHSELARAVEGAAGEGEGEPASAARAAFSLGAALCARGRWNDARAPLLRSLERSDALSQDQRSRVASAMARVEYKSRGDLSSAADLYAIASGSSTPSPAVDSPDPHALEQEAEALEGAAGLLRHAGREADALACYRSSLAARAALASLISPRPALLSLEAASTSNNAAVLLASAGARSLASGDAEAARRKFGEAGDLYREALRAREGSLGPDDPSVAAVSFNLAALAARAGDRDSARERLQRAASVRELALGRDSAELAEVHAALALWSVAGAPAAPAPVASVSGAERPTSGVEAEKNDRSSLCLSKREARAHARAALSIFEELERRCEGEELSRERQQRQSAMAQLRRFLGGRV